MAPPSENRPRGRLVYLTLQGLHHGQAAHAHVHEIIAGLRRRGWQVELFAPNYGGRSPSILSRMFEFIAIQLRLWSRWQGRALYLRGHFGAFPTSVLARLLRIPVFYEVNGTTDDMLLAWPNARLVHPLFCQIVRLQLRMASGVIAVTDELRDWVRTFSGQENIAVIPNGANHELFRPIRGQDVRAEPYVLFFGALARWQGIESMLEAAAHSSWPPVVKLVIAGDGPLRESVRLASLKNPAVRLLDTRPYEEMPRLICHSLAVVSVQGSTGGRSQKGLMPLKVFEAMSCGVPVIVSDFPGMAPLVRTSGAGLIVAPDDPTALAESVRRLWNDPELRVTMGRNGRFAVETEHSWDRRAESTDRFIASFA